MRGIEEALEARALVRVALLAHRRRRHFRQSRRHRRIGDVRLRRAVAGLALDAGVEDPSCPRTRGSSVRSGGSPRMAVPAPPRSGDRAPRRAWSSPTRRRRARGTSGSSRPTRSRTPRGAGRRVWPSAVAPYAASPRIIAEPSVRVTMPYRLHKAGASPCRGEKRRRARVRTAALPGSRQRATAYSDWRRAGGRGVRRRARRAAARPRCTRSPRRRGRSCRRGRGRDVRRARPRSARGAPRDRRCTAECRASAARCARTRARCAGPWSARGRRARGAMSAVVVELARRRDRRPRRSSRAAGPCRAARVHRRCSSPTARRGCVVLRRAARGSRSRSAGRGRAASAAAS